MTPVLYNNNVERQEKRKDYKEMNTEVKIWEIPEEAREQVEGWKKFYPYAYGQITRYEAGIIYRAMKEGKITIKKETISSLYDYTKNYVRFARERYSQNWILYDEVYNIVEFILNEEYASAQKKIVALEEHLSR